LGEKHSPEMISRKPSETRRTPKEIPGGITGERGGGTKRPRNAQKLLWTARPQRSEKLEGSAGEKKGNRKVLYREGKKWNKWRVGTGTRQETKTSKVRRTFKGGGFKQFNQGRGQIKGGENREKTPQGKGDKFEAQNQRSPPQSIKKGASNVDGPYQKTLAGGKEGHKMTTETVSQNWGGGTHQILEETRLKRGDLEKTEGKS